MYVGGEGGGAWRRDAAGWTPLTDSQPTLATGSIAIDPSDSNVLYVGTGSIASPVGYYGIGILKSTDGGTTWTNIVGPFLPDPVALPGDYLGSADGGARIVALAVSPTDSSVLLAGVSLHGRSLVGSGLFRSGDAGLTWTRVRYGVVPSSLLFDPRDGNTVFAPSGSFSLSGLYRSRDAGLTWSRLSVTEPEFPLDRVGTIGLAMSRSNPSILYAGISDAADLAHLLGFYKTIDGGDHWMRITTATDYCAEACFLWNALAVHPMNSDIVVAGGERNPVHRSLDGGVTWLDISGVEPAATHADVSVVSFSPDGSTLYVASDGGIASTTTYASSTPTWSFINDGLGITQIYPGFDVDPARRDYAFIRTQDNGTQLFRGSLAWTGLNDVEGGFIVYDAPSDTAYTAGNVLAPETGAVPYGTFVTTTGIPPGEPFGFGGAVPFTLNRITTNIQYTASNRVFQTVNAQALWTPITPALTVNPFAFITTLAVAEHNPDVVCAGTTEGHVWCTSNARAGVSSTWTDRSTGLPSRAVTRITINRFKEYEFIATFSGLSGIFGDTLGHVFLSTDSGASWSDISGNLPNAPANAAIFDNDIAPLFVATDAGVFRTLDGGTTWAPLARGLPQAHPTDLLMHDATRTLFTVTPGRGMWRITAPFVDSTPLAAITMSPWRMRFTAHFGGPPPSPQPLSVTNPISPIWGSTPLHWSASPHTAFGGAWLLATPSSGVDNGTVSVSIDVTGLPLGLYNGTVRLDDPASTNGPQDLLVLLSITDTAPIAMAGADIVVDATTPAGASVTLDGSASSDPDGDPLTFSWIGPFGKASGAKPVVQVPIGSYPVTLTVSDPAGLNSSAVAKVTVNGVATQIAELISAVLAIGGQHMTPAMLNALSAVLQNALSSEGKPPLCPLLRAFERQVSAFAGHGLTTAQASQLKASAQRIEAVARCR